MKIALGVLLLFPLLLGAAAFPDLALYDLSGKKAAAVSDFKGEVVLLNFWASWCSPCRVELPILQKIAQARAKDPVRILTINLDDKAAKAQAFIQRYGLALPVYRIKPEMARELNITAVPFSIVLDKKGEPAGTWAGLHSDFEAKIGALIGELLKK